MKHRYHLEGPFTHDVVISHIRITPQETTPVNLFVARDPDGARRDYILYGVLVPGPEDEDDRGYGLLVSTAMTMRAGASMWVEGDSPLITAHGVARP